MTNHQQQQLRRAGPERQARCTDFWATWCGPCKRLAPAIEALAEEYHDQAIIGKCDVEEDEELSIRFGVRNIPTVLFIKDGEVKDKVVGLAPKQALEDKLKALL